MAHGQELARGSTLHHRPERGRTAASSNPALTGKAIDDGAESCVLLPREAMPRAVCEDARSDQFLSSHHAN